ncbi:MAG: putative DNA binding domain-containing protein [Methanothrix sp.]|jgi:ATP-dependent DNA helicase RecG|uniref:ATP-binding protein n=1 Tax=Methanothrix sp. TaxID=90426 RepID=UPI0025F20B6C|nr:ATP-binding protein [Methanothrix sp.]MCK9407250.1 putative DNA binding domain-containing protein [Methanothrix sp.]
MEEQELESMLKDLESDLVERKASLSDPDRIRQVICAYANDLPNHRKPGFIFIGANDDGSCSGLEISDELLLKISNLKDDGKIQPFPSMSIDKKSINGCMMVLVQVEPSNSPPVRLSGVTWIRVGPRRARATPEEEKRLAERRRSRDLPFDLQPVPSATIEDLDLELFEHEYLPHAIDPSVLDQNTRSMEDKLKALRFLTPDGQPTVLGILVLGKDTLRFIPGAYVQFLRLEGVDLTDPIRHQREIAGPIPDLLRRIDEILEANNSVSISIVSESVEIRRSEYPLPALQQLIRNAILHRTYEGTNAPVRVYWFSDRIEIHNPGGPFGLVTKENFGQPGVTDYRNPHLAEAMHVLGYVQRFGMGIQIARKQLLDNGNPPPEFTIEENYILAAVRRRA